MTKEHNQSTQPLPEDIALLILQGFESHYSLFAKIALKAKKNFEKCLWSEQEAISKKRLRLYDKKVDDALRKVKQNYNFDIFDEKLWVKTKTCYVNIISSHSQPELAETFYNSFFCRLFVNQAYYNNNYIFLRPTISTSYIDIDDPVIFSEYTNVKTLPATLLSIIQSLEFKVPFEDLQRDVHELCRKIISQLDLSDEQGIEIQYIRELFLRQKGAYLIGRIKLETTKTNALAIAFLNEPHRNIYVDAVVTDNNSLANIFSFARSYFFIYTQFPGAVVDFIQSILPFSTAADIYSAIGLHKHGKNLLYRLFVKQSHVSSEKLKRSPGIRGMVMTVFGGESYPYVYKIINDNFAPPKMVTHKIVREKYQFVKRHAKLGRMADTWEFSNVVFPRHKISEDFLEEMGECIPSQLIIKNKEIIIRHLYMENKMMPLNLYLERANEEQTIVISRDFCQAIVDLIQGGIFPGDMLTKNFGVTGQNRVIFYDYDEITTMDIPVFRLIPEPKTIEEEYASEPWYSIGKDDVFPEEFTQFMATNKILRRIFTTEFKKLTDYLYWKEIQDNYKKNITKHYYPYEQKFRL